MQLLYRVSKNLCSCLLGITGINAKIDLGAVHKIQQRLDAYKGLSLNNIRSILAIWDPPPSPLSVHTPGLKKILLNKIPVWESYVLGNNGPLQAFVEYLPNFRVKFCIYDFLQKPPTEMAKKLWKVFVLCHTCPRHRSPKWVFYEAKFCPGPGCSE